MTFLDIFVILSCVMVEIRGDGGIVRYTGANQARGGRPSFNPENNANILLKNIERILSRPHWIMQLANSLTLADHLKNVGDEFLNVHKQLSYDEKAIIVQRAREIFNQKKVKSLNSETRTVVNDFFCSLLEKLALGKTGKVADQRGVTTVQPSARLQDISNRQNNTGRFLEQFAKLLESTVIKDPGYGRYPDTNRILATLLESSDSFDQDKRDILITTLKVADEYFKYEKDHYYEQPYARLAKILIKPSIKRKDRHGKSRYEELGGLSTEANGITLRKDFAEALESLLKTYEIVRPANQFQDTAYPYLNTLALEAAVDKFRNPL